MSNCRIQIRHLTIIRNKTIRSSSFIYGDGRTCTRTVYVYTGEWIFTNSLHDSPADPSGLWTHIISNPISIEKWTWVNFYRYSLNWGFETFYRDRLIGTPKNWNFCLGYNLYRIRVKNAFEWYLNGRNRIRLSIQSQRETHFTVLWK